MSRRVPDDRLQLMHMRVAGDLRRVAKNDKPGATKSPVWVTVDARELAPLLDELRRRRQAPGQHGGFKESETTRALMAMAVGDVIDLPPITQGALTTLRATARKRLENPDARWHGETLPSGYVRVTRKPDGSKHEYGLPKSPAVALIAAMNLNGRITIPKGQFPASGLHAGIKAQARLAMNYPPANWRTEKLHNGNLRVRRIA